MVKNINKRFTKWYVKRGYTFGYDFSGVPVVKYGPFRAPLGVPDSQFTCSWWVKPLLIFFSPSVYYVETTGRLLSEGLMEGMKMALREKENELCQEKQDHI